jgi:hypothetical protein
MFNQTTGASILKETYTPRRVEKLTAEANRFSLWSLLDKREHKLVKGAFGKQFIIPMHVNDSEAVGVSIATAETASGTTGAGGEVEYKNFAVTPVKFYGSAKVDGSDATMADGNDMGSFLDATKAELDSVMRTMSRRFAIYAHGAGYSELGQIKAGSSVTSTTIVVRRGDRRKFRKGMSIRVSQTLTSVVRTGTGRITNIASDGTLTLTGVDPSAQSWAAGDFIFSESVSTANPKARVTITGLAAYNPATEPTTTTTLHGLDISTDWRLNGMRFDASTATDVLDGLSKLMIEMDAEGEPPTHAIANTEDWSKVVALLPDQTVYKTGVGEGTVGFETVKVRCPGGVVELISDPTAEVGQIRCFNKAHLFWAYNGDSIINIINEDGNTWRKVAGEDAFSVQLRALLALCCDKPNSLGVLYNVT